MARQRWGLCRAIANVSWARAFPAYSPGQIATLSPSRLLYSASDPTSEALETLAWVVYCFYQSEWCATVRLAFGEVRRG